MKTAAVLSLLVVALVIVSAVVNHWIVFYVVVPIVLASGLIVLRGHPPARAIATGTFATFIIGVILRAPIIAAQAFSNGFGTDDYCDGICVSHTEAFAVAVVLIAIVSMPIAVVGGIVAALASLASRRHLSHA